MAKSTALVLSQSQRDIFDQMSAEWQAETNHVLQLLNAYTEGEIRTRHEIGVVTKKFAEGEAKYGTAAIVNLSITTGISKTMLYSMKKLATVYSKKSLDSFLTKVKKGGQLVTYSHIEQLLTIPQLDNELRTEQERVLAAQRVSVRDLHEKISAGLRLRAAQRMSEKTGEPVQPPPTRSLPKSPLAGLSQARRLTAGVLSSGEGMTEGVFNRIQTAGPDQITEPLLVSLEAYLHAQEQLRDHAITNIQHTQESLVRVREVLSTPRVKPDPEPDSVAEFEPEDEYEEDVQEEAPAPKARKAPDVASRISKAKAAASAKKAPAKTLKKAAPQPSVNGSAKKPQPKKPAAKRPMAAAPR